MVGRRRYRSSGRKKKDNDDDHDVDDGDVKKEDETYSATRIPLHAIQQTIYQPINPIYPFLLFSTVSLYTYLKDVIVIPLFSILLIFLTIHLYCRYYLGGFTEKLQIPNDEDIFVPLPSKTFHTGRSPVNNEKKTILVTGGCGFLGWTIIKQLTIEHPYSNIVALDLYLPSKSRTVENVKYIVADISHDELTLIDIDIIIHTAGCVDLTIDEGITHNAHIVGTARLLVVNT